MSELRIRHQQASIMNIGTMQVVHAGTLTSTFIAPRYLLVVVAIRNTALRYDSSTKLHIFGSAARYCKKF